MECGVAVAALRLYVDGKIGIGAINSVGRKTEGNTKYLWSHLTWCDAFPRSTKQDTLGASYQAHQLLVVGILRFVVCVELCPVACPYAHQSIT